MTVGTVDTKQYGACIGYMCAQVHKEEPMSKRGTSAKRSAAAESVSHASTAVERSEEPTPPAFPSWIKKARPRVDTGGEAMAQNDVPAQAASSGNKTPSKTCTSELSGAPTPITVKKAQVEQDRDGEDKGAETELVLPVAKCSKPAPTAGGSRTMRGRDLVAMAQQTGREQALQAAADIAAQPTTDQNTRSGVGSSALPEALAFLESERERDAPRDTPSASKRAGPHAAAPGCAQSTGSQPAGSAMHAAVSFLESERRMTDVRCVCT